MLLLPVGLQHGFFPHVGRTATVTVGFPVGGVGCVWRGGHAIICHMATAIDTTNPIQDAFIIAEPNLYETIPENIETIDRNAMQKHATHAISAAPSINESVIPFSPLRFVLQAESALVVSMVAARIRATSYPHISLRDEVEYQHHIF